MDILFQNDAVCVCLFNDLGVMLRQFLLLLGPLTVSTFKIPVLYDSTNNLHRDVNYHPEQPARIDVCLEALKERTEVNPDFINLMDIADTSPYKFSQEELKHARSMLVEVHSERYVARIEKKCYNSRQQRIDEGREPLGFIGYLDQGDTYITTESYDVCLRATAAWIRAVDLSLESGNPAMALTRPPGHHATRALSNGFCVFNFCAVAAAHAVKKGLRVAVLDWDVHYGQGVADILKRYPEASYTSIHQIPAFPYMGESESIAGEHENIKTIPITAETTWTCGYREAFTENALPFVQQWKPDLVIVSSGYDALDSDELASVSLQAVDYGKMTTALKDSLDPSTNLVLGLEGGYQLSKFAGGGGLTDAVLSTLEALG